MTSRPRRHTRGFEPGFYVEHFIKDIGIALPGLALVRQLYESVRALDHGRKGTQALMLALEAMNGVKR